MRNTPQNRFGPGQDIRSGGETQFVKFLSRQGVPRAFFPKSLTRFDYEAGSGWLRCGFESAEGLLSPSGSICFEESIVFKRSEAGSDSQDVLLDLKSGIRIASEIFGLKVVAEVESIRFRGEGVVLNHEFGSEIMSISDFQLTEHGDP